MCKRHHIFDLWCSPRCFGAWFDVAFAVKPLIAFGSQQQFEANRFLSVGNELAVIDTTGARVNIYQVSCLAQAFGPTASLKPRQTGTQHIVQFMGEMQADKSVLHSISANSSCEAFSFEELRCHDVKQIKSGGVFQAIASAPISASTLVSQIS
jgi:hypothetical protein